MQWERSDGFDRRVVKRSGWCALWHIDASFPSRAGVYIFADTNLQVKYVGKAGAGRLRKEATAARDERGKGYGAIRAVWLATNSDANALSLERELIDKYDPPNNDR